jgi:acyl carrier protein
MLVEHCRAKLEAHKVPGRIVLTDELPKGRSGKVVLAEARALAERAATTPGQAGPADGDLEARLLTTAARIFKTEPSRLTLASSPEDVAGWDSLAHLELVAALEIEFGVNFSSRQIMALDSLARALGFVRGA